MRLFLALLLLCAPIYAVAIDRSATKFEVRKKKRVETYDFTGDFPNLEQIDIDARKKKRVAFHLTGDFPLLERVIYDGSFGELDGELTGSFPNLRSVAFLCTSCAINLDMRGDWQQSCEIEIRGMKEDIALTLPGDVGLVVHTKTGPRGKVRVQGLKKKGWWHILKKTYRNELAKSAPIVLTLNVETTEGNILLSIDE